MNREPEGELEEEKKHFSYHYRREERLSLHNAPTPLPRKGLFRGNPALAVLTLNFLLLMLVIFIVYPLLYRCGEEAVLSGYRLKLYGTLEGDAVVATLSVQDIQPKPPQDQGQIRVRFFLDPSGRAGLSGRLPAAGAVLILREVLPAAPKAAQLNAEVSIGAKSRRLSVKLAAPKD